MGSGCWQLGIPTPHPVACIDEFRGPLLWRSWLVTEYVDGPNPARVLENDEVPPVANAASFTRPFGSSIGCARTASVTAI